MVRYNQLKGRPVARIETDDPALRKMMREIVSEEIRRAIQPVQADLAALRDQNTAILDALQARGPSTLAAPGGSTFANRGPEVDQFSGASRIEQAPADRLGQAAGPGISRAKICRNRLSELIRMISYPV